MFSWKFKIVSGGGEHVSCSGKYSVCDVFQLNIKGIQDAVKTYTLILLYLKLCTHSILSNTLPVWTRTWSHFLFIPLALGFVETWTCLVKECKFGTVGLIYDYKYDILQFMDSTSVICIWTMIAICILLQIIMLVACVAFFKMLLENILFSNEDMTIIWLL